MRYDLVIFDMDGTISDSYLSVTKTFQHTLREMSGLEIENLDEFRRFIGPPLVETFGSYGFHGPELTRALTIFREHYLTTLADTVVYPGIPQLLAALKQAGARMAVASNKLTTLVCQLLERDGLKDYFDIVVGWEAEDDSQPSTKADAIRGALAHYQSGEYSKAVMVGDRFYDAQGAQQTGLDFVAAGYGPGTRAEFAPYPMAFYAETVADLGQFLLG